MKKKKNILFKIIIVIVDIIALTLFIIAAFKWFDKKINNHDNEVFDQQQIFTFKKFNYNIHDEIEYSNIDENRFMLSTDSYNAIVMPYVADTDLDDVPLNSYISQYEEYLRNNNIDVIDTSTIEIDDKIIYTYDISDKVNSILCYYQTFQPFYYEIELMNKSNSFDKEPLNEIITVLEDVYYDQESKQKFKYYTSYGVFHKFDIDE